MNTSMMSLRNICIISAISVSHHSQTRGRRLTFVKGDGLDVDDRSGETDQ